MSHWSDRIQDDIPIEDRVQAQIYYEGDSPDLDGCRGFAMAFGATMLVIAVLCGVWLAGKCGWEPKEMDVHTGHYSRPTREVTLR